MALAATVYRLEVDLSDVDRGVYEVLDLRVARHPSETEHYLLARVFAYCLFYEEGIAFTHGLSTADEPAIWVKDPQGNVTLWLEVGSPSAERLHKASKYAPRVVVLTHHDPSTFLRQLRGHKIHRHQEIRIFSLPPDFLDAIVPELGRHTRLALVRNESELYVTIGERSLSTRLAQHTIEES